MSRAIPPDSFEQTLDKARAALKLAASVGVTTIQDMTANAAELRAYQALHASNELTARIYSIQNHGDRGAARRRRDAPASATTGCASAASSCSPTDRWARAPRRSSSLTPTIRQTSGLLIQSPEALEKAMIDADAAGFQLIVHAIGDRANTIVLDIMEKMARAKGRA